MASESTDVELLGSAWPQKGTAALGCTLWRLFIIFFFFLVKGGFSPTLLQSEVRRLMDQQAEKIMEERFKAPGVCQGFGAESSVACAIPLQSFGGRQRCPRSKGCCLFLA